MTPTITTTRRSLLAAAPAIAVAAVIPGKAVASDLSGWHRVKADYEAAHAAECAAIDLQTKAEEALSQFWQTAPERTISYTVEAFSTAGGISVPAMQHTVSLMHRDIAQPHLSASLRTSPEYLDYCRAVQAWKNDPAHIAAQEAFNASDAATTEAMHAKIEAWQAMVDFPLSDTTSIAEKVTLAIPYVDGCGEWGERLLVAVQADLARATA